MKITTLKLIALLLSPIVLMGSSYSAPLIYTAVSGDTLSEIVLKNFSWVNLYGEGGLLDEIIKINPAISDPDLIFPGQEILLKPEWKEGPTEETHPHLEIPPEVPVKEVVPAEEVFKVEAPTTEAYSNSQEDLQKGTYLIGFYTASRGTLSEQSKVSPRKINFLQNSFITLGALYGRRLSPKHNLSLSAYASKFNEANVKGQAKRSIPWEIGSNAYLEVSTFKSFNLYGGVDYEHFNTAHMPRLVADPTDFRLVQNQLIYATGGVSYYGFIGNKRIISKVSLARSILSRITNSLDPYQGNRYQFFISHPIAERFAISALYKIHDLDASDRKIRIQRLGLGFGYQF